MKPSAGTAAHNRRRLAVLLTILLGCADASAKDETCSTLPRDPRLDELLKADPNDGRIGVESDAGELGRDGHADLQGNVRIRMGQRLLRADSAELDSEQRSVRLRGHVEYLDPRLHLEGDGGSFDGTANGTFQGARFELLDRDVRGSAANAEMHEQGQLELNDVTYTACPAGDEDWQLRAGEISLNQKTQIGTGRDVRLDFKGVPIVYTPWISFPVGDQRKSGLLFPTIGNSSKTGTQIAVPYYWNIAPDRDATLTTRYYSSRGLRLDPEFRYLSDNQRGVINVQYLYDDLQTGDSRSLVEIRHVTRFLPRTRLYIDAANVSDSNYFEDFGAGFEGTSVTFLNRSAELRHEIGPWSFVGRGQNYQVIDEDLPDVDEPYSLAPQLAVLGRWRDLPGGLSAALRAEASNFTRDLGPEGLRVDAEPAVGWRAGRGGVYVAADAALRYTGYALSNIAAGLDDSPSRTAPVLSVDTGLVLERPSGSRHQRVMTLEPRLLYLYVPFREQDDLPVFDTALPDLNLVELFRTNRYVGADRLSDANQVSAGITTRLLDAADGRQYLSATLGQSFYFEEPRVHLPDETPTTRSSSNIVAELNLEGYKHWSSRLALEWDPDLTRSTSSEFSLQYRPGPGRVVNGGYRFRRGSVEQFDFSAAWPINRQWRGVGRWVYSKREQQTLDRFIGLEYTSCCWALRLVARRFLSNRTGDSDTSIALQLELKGLSSVGIDNEAFLRSAIRGYSAVPAEPKP
jgi:LPS-assembly protein